MEVEWLSRDGIGVAKISGKIDSNTAPELSRQLEEKIGGLDGALAIDFTNVEYISSAGLRVVIKANHLLSAKGEKVILCGLKDYVREVFDMAGLGRILDIREQLEEAFED